MQRAQAGALGREVQDVALGVAIGSCTGGAGLWTLHWRCSALGGVRSGAGRRAADSVIRQEQRALHLSSHRIALRAAGLGAAPGDLRL